MAIEVRGFVQIPSFKNNAENAIANIGELSLEAQTFARDRQEYYNEAKDVVELVIFKCVDNGVKATMPVDLRELCIDIFVKAYKDFTTSKNFLTQVKEAFPQLVNVDVGPDQVYLGRLFTTRLSFKVTLGTTECNVTLWASDVAFQNEYTDNETHVVAPAFLASDLQGDFTAVKAAVDAFTVSQRFNAQKAIIGSHPPTDVQVVTLKWQDPFNPALNFLTEWSIIGYGRGAFVYENMIEAIRQHLVKETGVPDTEWVKYFPELDNIDIIYLFPQWERVALSSSVTPGQGSDLYSTMMQYDVAMDNARKIISGVSLTVIRKYADVFSHVHKSIILMSIGSEQNSVGAKRLSDVYPRYAVLDVNDINNGRLPADVTAFTEQLNRVLILAESDDGLMALPSGYVRQTVGTGNFIEFVLSGVTFRLCNKKSWLETI